MLPIITYEITETWPNVFLSIIIPETPVTICGRTFSLKFHGGRFTTLPPFQIPLKCPDKARLGHDCGGQGLAGGGGGL